MATFKTDGLDGLIAKLEAHGKKVNGVVNHMLNAGAKIMVEEQKATMLELGIMRHGDLVKSVKSSGIKNEGGGAKSVSISPSGKDRKGVSNNLKAYVAEYGRSGMPARPWKALAEARAMPKIEERQREIFEEEMNK